MWQILLILCALLYLLWQWIHAPAAVRIDRERWDKYPLQVHFIDVGHGDSILLLSQGHAMLIDGGMPFRSKTVQRYLRTCGVEHLDAIVCTHEHWDHAGGLRGVVQHFPFDRAYAPVDRADCVAKGYFNRFAAEVAQRGHTLERPALGEVWQLGEAQIKVIGPLDYDPPNHAENNRSIVLRVTYGETSLLLTGDAERYAHEAMMKSGAELASDVVKVGHHGIRQDKAFYEAVAPKIAVFSCANMSKERSADIERELRGMGIELWFTREAGSIVCASDGQSWTVGKSAE